MLKSLICHFKGHDMAYTVDYQDVPKGGRVSTVTDLHTRQCKRCGYVEVKAVLTWSLAVCQTFFKRKVFPRAIIERNPQGVLEISVTTVPAPGYVDPNLKPKPKRRPHARRTR